MSNFGIEFLNSPWWLILIIPAVFLTLFPYFRIAKKYRRNRNRIISLVLHLVIMVLCITVLSGMYFTYETPNTDNEVLILVDMSFSSEEHNNVKNEFVRSVIDESNSKYKVGVVTFGYNQVYAAELSTDTEKVYREYINANLPDDSASDIASALNYARSLFKSKSTAKIVLVSDGAETDSQAILAVRSLVANDIQVNTVSLNNSYDDEEVQIVDITLPEYNISLDEAFQIGVTVQNRSRTANSAVITLYDSNSENDEEVISSIPVEIPEGTQSYSLTCSLSTPGMHKLRCSIESDKDTLDYNNEYYSYICIEKYNNLLVLERDSGESSKLVEVLGDDYNVTVKDINDVADLPATVNDLREYDEVILMNIANSDMPVGFIDLLYTYVNNIGGGLLTIGGSKVNEAGETVANAYDRQDMYGTLYQEMLPVQAINYTPPLGVMIIVDRSGSMSSSIVSGKSRLDQAKEGARACLYALSERDYCGIMTLDDEFQVEQSLIPATQQARLLKTISDITIGGGTKYSGAIVRAGKALMSLRNVERRHIILISDAYPSDTYEEYSQAIIDNLNSGITFSMVAIGVPEGSADADMAKAAEAGNGRYYSVWDDTLSDKMSQELKLDEIIGYNPEPFQPRIRDHTSVVSGINQADIPNLGGYYGTKIKDGADVPLAGDYVPIFANWRFGEGRVGSFMSDLNGNDWSSEFMNNEVGVKLVFNMINALLPTQSIRSTGIEVEFVEDNYSTYASVITDLEKGDRVELTVKTIPLSDGEAEIIQKLSPTEAEGYSRFTFQITTPGVYEVVITKLDANNNLIAEHTAYRTFSYSKEYDMFVDMDVCIQLMTNLAAQGKGKVIGLNESWVVFEDMKETLDNMFDPRWLFIIIAMVLFLLDIAVRKFKFKWIHEILRERREKKQGEMKVGVSKTSE